MLKDRLMRIINHCKAVDTKYKKKLEESLTCIQNFFIYKTKLLPLAKVKCVISHVHDMQFNTSLVTNFILNKKIAQTK